MMKTDVAMQGTEDNLLLTLVSDFLIVALNLRCHPDISVWKGSRLLLTGQKCCVLLDTSCL